MAIKLTETEVQLLKVLAAAGEHGRAVTATRAVFAHLIRAGCIVERRATHPDAKAYTITRFGRKALAEAMN